MTYSKILKLGLSTMFAASVFNAGCDRSDSKEYTTTFYAPHMTDSPRMRVLRQLQADKDYARTDIKSNKPLKDFAIYLHEVAHPEEYLENAEPYCLVSKDLGPFVATVNKAVRDPVITGRYTIDLAQYEMNSEYFTVLECEAVGAISFLAVIRTDRTDIPVAIYDSFTDSLVDRVPQPDKLVPAPLLRELVK